MLTILVVALYVPLSGFLFTLLLKGYSLTTMTLRGIDEHLAHTLKELARNQGVSLNSLALRLIREATGVDKRKRTLVHHDLDTLADAWSEKDEAAFQVAMRSLETIDEKMWK